MTKKFIRGSASLLAFTVLAACGGGGEPEIAADSSAAAPVDSSGGMAGMAGMAGMGAMDTTAMQQMHSHMETMAAGDAAQMQGMNAGADWDETVEAVRQDLAGMPEMTPEEFKTFLPEHRDRMNKLMEMHRSMMASM